MSERSSSKEAEGRPSIIAAVKTPLAFFALALLVGEACLLVFAVKAEGIDRTIGIVGMISLLGLAGAAVYSLAFRKDLARGAIADQQFCRQLAGVWWERIHHSEGSSLSFLSVTCNPQTGEVALAGTSYGQDGQLRARWQSEMVRLYPSDQRLAYVWRGKHPLPGISHHNFHGYGTMEFKTAEDASLPFTHGDGDFWDVDQAHPEKTAVKPIELRRVLDAGHKQIMTSGSSEQKRDLVVEVIHAW